MTTYILKDTLEELKKQVLTKQILYILDASEEKVLTRAQIKKKGIHRYGGVFKTDDKGERIYRYLKTMEKYGLVEEQKQGTGKSTLWKKLETSEKLDFQVVIQDHIKRFQRIADEKPEYVKRKGIVIHGIAQSYISEFDSNRMNEINDLINNLGAIVYEIDSIQQIFFYKLLLKISRETRERLDSTFEKWLVDAYAFCLLFGYSSFDISKGGFVNFGLFKKDTFPYVVEFAPKVFNLISKDKRLLEKYTKEKLWGFNHYQLSKEFSESLFLLHEIMFKHMKIHPLFTVVCDIERDDNMFTEKLLSDDKMRALIEKFLSYVQKIPKGEYDKLAKDSTEKEFAKKLMAKFEKEIS